MERQIPPPPVQSVSTSPRFMMRLPENYQFIQMLGRGTQGQVCYARRKSDGLNVAIKQLNIESVKSWKEYELFRREAEILSSLNIHGVAKFYEAIECLDDDPPCSYIVQEYIAGTSLARLMQSGHRFSIDRVYSIIIQLLKILQQLHTHTPPVIHRDIKPSNILLKPNGDDYLVYLIDFGAVANPQVQGGGSTVAGTFGYMPPEQLMGNPVPASDVYALAAVAVHLMSGRSPAEMPVKDFHLIFEPDLQNMPVVVVNTLRRMLEPKVEMRLCDIPTLIGIFSDFKRSVYRTVDTRADASMSAEEYNESLSRVQSYAEPGAIELWQRLPDETPRAVVDVYKNIPMPKDLKTKAQIAAETVQITPKVQVRLQDYLLLNPNETFNITSFLLCFFVIYPFYILAGASMSVIVWMPLMILSIDGVILPHFFFYISIGIILISVAIFCHWMAKKVAKERASTNSAIPSKKQTPSVMTKEDFIRLAKMYKNILTNGRKAIATITQIQYIPVDAVITGTGNIYTTGEPQFRIQYKFNPPDDLREDDIYFSLTVHDLPPDEYHVGDPFPILYCLDRHEDNFIGRRVTEIVSAIPFPIPVPELKNIDKFVSVADPVVDYPDEAGVARIKRNWRGVKLNSNSGESDSQDEFRMPELTDDKDYSQLDSVEILSLNEDHARAKVKRRT